MEESQFQQLIEDIRENGQRVEIVKIGEEIVDGRKRFRACELLGIEPRVIDLSGQDPEQVSYSLNILRTHYTSGQRAMFAARRAKLLKGYRKPDISQKGEVVTQARAAQEAGVSVSKIAAAKRIRREGAPEVTAAVEAGRLSLHSAEEIVTSVPIQEQPAIVDRVIKAAQGKRKQTPAKVLGKTKGFNRSPRRPIAERIERGIAQTETAGDLLLLFMSEDREVHSVAWVKRLCVARTVLSRVIDLLRKRS